MRTREEAGRPGVLGRVGAAGRVALGGLWLPAHALEVLPPGARALVETGDGPILLHPVEPPDGTSP
jgi:hypothetical protein